MTLMVAWVGNDTHGTSSAYIVSESRVSWPVGKFKYDACRKVFCSSKYPDIFGYCGDVLFPSIVINQLLEIIDAGLFFKCNDSCERRLHEFKQKLICEFNKYLINTPLSTSAFQVIHINREIGPANYLPFSCQIITWTRKDDWQVKKLQIPKESRILVMMGSGRKEFEDNYIRLRKEAKSNTSRFVFHSFIETMKNITTNTCGGPPQMVGLYRKPGSCGRNYGLIYEKKRYVLGTQVVRAADYNVIEWRNKYFEICDGKTKQRLPNAANQMYNVPS